MIHFIYGIFADFIIRAVVFLVPIILISFTLGAVKGDFKKQVEVPTFQETPLTTKILIISSLIALFLIMVIVALLVVTFLVAVTISVYTGLF